MNGDVSRIRFQILLRKKFKQVPIDVFHLHVGHRAQRDQHIRMRGERDRRVLSVSARKRNPQQILLRPLFEQGNDLVDRPMGRRTGIGRNMVLLYNRRYVLLSSRHGEGDLVVFYRQNICQVEEIALPSRPLKTQLSRKF